MTFTHCLMPSTAGYQTVLFDLDGTLIDHFNVIYRCYCHAQQQLDLPLLSFQTVKQSVGGSMPVTMERLLGPEKAPEAIPLFRAHFNEIFLDDVKALDGALWILKSLHCCGIQTAVFTNKIESATRPICEQLGFMPYLSAVFGTHDDGLRKPMPEFTEKALSQLGASSANTLMVGDSPFDVQAASTHGLLCHCVTTGSHDAEALRSEAPEIAGIWPDLKTLGTEVLGL
jgi:phosphoglycolate phosphatase